MRTESDIRMLINHTRNVHMFSKLSAKVHMSLCRYMGRADLNAGAPVFYQGEEGEFFYVILSGSIALHMDRFNT